MGAEDGGISAPDQFTTAKWFSKTFGLVFGGFFYIRKKKKNVLQPKCFFQSIKWQHHAITLPLTQLRSWRQHPDPHRLKAAC